MTGSDMAFEPVSPTFSRVAEPPQATDGKCIDLPQGWCGSDFIPPDPTDTTIVDEVVTLMLTRYRTGS